MDPLHYIHSRAGRIGGRSHTQSGDVDAIIRSLGQDPRRHLVIHFHGGLVPAEAGFSIAEKLKGVYSPSPDAGGYPVFFVWESGAWETIRNNLTELADEPVFKELLRKILQYAFERLGGSSLTGFGRSIDGAAYGSAAVAAREELDRFWKDPRKETIPFREMDVDAHRAMIEEARSVVARVDEAEILVDIQQDRRLQNALATLPDLPPSSRSSLSTEDVQEHRSSFAELASTAFSKDSGTRGLVELYKVASYLARVLRGVLRRYSRKRDHGFYATCVEELIRGFKLAGSGLNEWGKALEWNRMKQDTSDAFGPNPDVHAGTALLTRLQAALNGGLELRRITLVGHSTGAIYIAHWIENSAKYLPATLKQDVVFLAPAITCDLFAKMVRENSSRVGRFRMFAMTDSLEREDQVWGQDEELPGGKDWRRFIYPSSLLYLVSGILESSAASDGSWLDEPDMPLVGMERFLHQVQIYPDAEFPSIQQTRTWLAVDPNAVVWSKSTGHAAGLNGDSIDHGAFNDNPLTLESLQHIVEVGF